MHVTWARSLTWQNSGFRERASQKSAQGLFPTVGTWPKHSKPCRTGRTTIKRRAYPTGGARSTASGSPRGRQERAAAESPGAPRPRHTVTPCACRCSRGRTAQARRCFARGCGQHLGLQHLSSHSACVVLRMHLLSESCATNGTAPCQKPGKARNQRPCGMARNLRHMYVCMYVCMYRHGTQPRTLARRATTKSGVLVCVRERACVCVRVCVCVYVCV